MLVTALCLCCVRLVMTRLAFVETRSIDPQCLWRTGQPGRLGDYAEFPLPDSALCPALSARISKRLVCGPGDYLARDERQFFCNGQPLAALNREQRPELCQSGALPVFDFDGPIPDGMAFALGDHPLSYDSRYWGLVSLATTERLIPLW